jgi:hypothetical protein
MTVPSALPGKMIVGAPAGTVIPVSARISAEFAVMKLSIELETLVA